MATKDLPPELATLADLQRGLVSRRQLSAAGISSAAIRHRALRNWRNILPDVVALSRKPLDDEQRLNAAQLRCGPDARVSGGTAAKAHGIAAVVDDGRDGTVLPSPDAWFDDVGLAVQVHSAQHHASPADWDRTVRTDSVFAEYGVSRLAVTPHEIRTQGAQVLARIERAHAARGPAPARDHMTPRRPGPT